MRIHFVLSTIFLLIVLCFNRSTLAVIIYDKPSIGSEIAAGIGKGIGEGIQSLCRKQEYEEQLNRQIKAQKQLMELAHQQRLQAMQYEYNLRQAQHIQDELEIEAQLKDEYPDFEEVVTLENCALLRKKYPKLAARINANTDTYTKAVAAYSAIKKLIVSGHGNFYSKNKIISIWILIFIFLSIVTFVIYCFKIHRRNR